MLARGKSVAGDCESEGSPRQTAGLTNRKRIEAAQRGGAAQIVEAQYLHGTLRRKSDRHSRKVALITLGDLHVCHCAVRLGEQLPARPEQASTQGNTVSEPWALWCESTAGGNPLPARSCCSCTSFLAVTRSIASSA